MATVVEITLCRDVAGRLTAGFVGWEVEAADGRTYLRRLGASAGDIQRALAEIADLGLELESVRRTEAPAGTSSSPTRRGGGQAREGHGHGQGTSARQRWDSSSRLQAGRPSRAEHSARR